MNENVIDTEIIPATRIIPPPDLAAVKTRQQTTWASGDYGQIGARLQIVGESVCEAVDLLAGERVLDVAAGNGNASLAAARCFAEVTSTDYVQELLERGRERAAADGLEMIFELADVEKLPYADASYDVVLSTFGVMFAPDQESAAREIVRVVRPGGRIGLANWTPEGFIGQLFGVMRAFVPPPAGVESPTRWGTPEGLNALFGAQVSDIRTTRKSYAFRYRSARHWIDFFRTWYGPVHKAFASLDEAGRRSLEEALSDLLDRHNTHGPASLVVPSEYLEVVITR